MSLIVLFLGCFIEYSLGGSCSYSGQCSRYAHKSCGVFGWSRCGYTQHYSCTKYRCCSGWTGSSCSTPICSPPCLNGGTCTRPGKCTCDVFHAGGHCQTELAVCIPPCGSGGKCIRPNTCQCDIYHYGSKCQYKKSCTNKQLELMFLLDSSGGIGKDNFAILKRFVESVIEQFDIAASKTRVGLMTFSRYPFIRFGLKDTHNVSQLLTEVRNIPYISGLTETHTALRLLQQEGFLGARSNVPHVAILITEGKSQHPNETRKVADELIKQGIVMFVIAVGKRVSLQEMQAIASNPDDKHLFIVNNHTIIGGIKGNITTLICDVSSHGYAVQTTPKPVIISHTRRNPIDECIDKLADIIFLLDSSTTLGEQHFKSVDHFAMDIINDFDIGTNATLVGVISFSTYPVRRIALGDSRDKLNLLNSVNQILYYPGFRETDRALQMLRLEGFENDRPEAPNVAILITNGPSTNQFLTQRAADELKQNGVELFVVGVGDGIDVKELEMIATKGGNHTFTSPNYLEFDLASFEGNVAEVVCEALPILSSTSSSTTSNTVTTSTETTTARKLSTTKTQECVPDVKDVIFLVDSSGSVGDDNFKHIKEFVKQTIRTFDIGFSKTRVGLILFNSHAKLIFPLDKYNSRHDLLDAVDNIAYIPGGTNTGEALDILRNQGFSNDRKNVPNIAFLITDGYSSDKNYTIEQATLAKENNHIQIVATAIGQLLDLQELSDIASSNPSTNRSLIYHVDDFDELHVFSLEKILSSVICGVELSTTSSTSLPTTQLCVDTVDNCDEYNQDMCTSYRPWAMAHCKRYCGFCQGVPEPLKPCVDAKSNCNEYGVDICHLSTFRKWSKDNCPRYCGFCDYTTTPTLPTTTSKSPQCIDLEDNCDEYDPDMCTKYQPWAKANCRSFCGFCQGVTPSRQPCVDTIGNCREYGHEICSSLSFKRWTNQHCARFCELCGEDINSTTTSLPSTTTSTTTQTTTSYAIPNLSCYDKEHNCESFGGRDMCTSYQPWAKANCELYCGFCNGPATPPKPCVDKVDNCREYGHDLCSSPAFTLWVKQHCARFCDLCDVNISSNSTSEIPVTTETFTVDTTVSPSVDELTETTQTGMNELSGVTTEIPYCTESNTGTTSTIVKSGSDKP